MQIMDRDLVDGRIQPEFIGFAMADAALDATAGEPCCKCVGVMISSRLGFQLGDR